MHLLKQLCLFPFFWSWYILSLLSLLSSYEILATVQSVVEFSSLDPRPRHPLCSEVFPNVSILTDGHHAPVTFNPVSHLL